MGRTERVIVALLVVTAAAAFALIPRLLSAPGGLPDGGFGASLGPSQSRSVVQALVIAGPPRGANVAHATQLPARVAAAPVGPVVRVESPPASPPGAVPPRKLPPPSPPSNPPPVDPPPRRILRPRLRLRLRPRRRLLLRRPRRRRLLRLRLCCHRPARSRATGMATRTTPTQALPDIRLRRHHPRLPPAATTSSGFSADQTPSPRKGEIGHDDRPAIREGLGAWGLAAYAISPLRHCAPVPRPAWETPRLASWFWGCKSRCLPSGQDGTGFAASTWRSPTSEALPPSWSQSGRTADVCGSFVAGLAAREAVEPERKESLASRGFSASCGTGTRTPTSGSRVRRPTIRRSRKGSARHCSPALR